MEYRKIPDYDQYEISQSGELRSVDRVVIHKNNKVFNVRGKTITHKKPKGSSYYQVILYKNGKYKGFRIHQLVAKAWLPNPNGYNIVNHKDGNKLNNHMSNLEWCSQADNIKHCKEVLGKNLNISLSKIMSLYESRSDDSLESFINSIKINCK